MLETEMKRLMKIRLEIVEKSHFMCTFCKLEAVKIYAKYTQVIKGPFASYVDMTQTVQHSINKWNTTNAYVVPRLIFNTQHKIKPYPKKWENYHNTFCTIPMSIYDDAE